MTHNKLRERNKIILQRYFCGEDIQSLAKEYGLTPSQIYRVFEDQEEYRMYRKEKTSNKVISRNKQMLDEYLNNGISAADIAAEHNISRQRVYQILSRNEEYKKYQSTKVANSKPSRRRSRDYVLIATAKENPDVPMSELVKDMGITEARGYEIIHEAGEYRSK